MQVSKLSVSNKNNMLLGTIGGSIVLDHYIKTRDIWAVRVEFVCKVDSFLIKSSVQSEFIQELFTGNEWYYIQDDS